MLPLSLPPYSQQQLEKKKEKNNLIKDKTIFPELL
jgi:hypothetical protein